MNERELFEKTNSRTLSGAYYFAGSEELTKQQAIDRILALLDPGFFDLNLKRQRAPEPLLLLDALRSVPVFDTLCVSIVTDFSDDEVFSVFNLSQYYVIYYNRFFDLVLIFAGYQSSSTINFFSLFSFLTSCGLLEQFLEFHFDLPAVFSSISLHIIWSVVAPDIPLYVCM